MSVPKSKRGYQKLEVLTKAIALADYTITVCKNEKNFPKRDRWIITNRIVTAALDICESVRKGNAVRVEYEDDYLLRRAYQQTATENCEWMLTLLDISYRNLGMEEKRLEYWTGLILEVEAMISKWRRSDRDSWREKQRRESSE